MNQSSSIELKERSQFLFKKLVERYILDGQPVGSRTLARDTRLDLSPATIRNVMSDLEEMGLISSPHTSSGRIPTVKGYRLFVDQMVTFRDLTPVEIEKMESRMENMMSNTVNIERLQKDVEKILSDIEKLKDKQRTFSNGDHQ